jgi:hypothetical protein
MLIRTEKLDPDLHRDDMRPGENMRNRENMRTMEYKKPSSHQT